MKVDDVRRSGPHDLVESLWRHLLVREYLLTSRDWLVSLSAPFLVSFPFWNRKIPHLDVWLVPGVGQWLELECSVSLSTSPRAHVSYTSVRMPAVTWTTPRCDGSSLCENKLKCSNEGLSSARTITGGLLGNQLIRLCRGCLWKGWFTGCSGKSFKKEYNQYHRLAAAKLWYKHTKVVVKSLD